jgi:hypothetical protein
VDFIHAFFNDLVLLLRLTAICGFTLGIGEACVCEWAPSNRSCECR